MSDKPLPPFLKRGIAIRATELTPMQKLLLYTLNTRADKFGTCFPSIEQLEIDTGLNERSVRRIMKQLRSLGLVIANKFGDHKQRNIYKLNLVRWQSTVLPGVTIQPGVSSQGLHIGTPDTESCVHRTLTTSHRTQSPLYPDTESGVSSFKRTYKRYIEEEAQAQPDSKRKEELQKKLDACNYAFDNIKLQPETLSTHFSSFKPIDLNGGTLIMATDREFDLNWCLSHYEAQLSEMNVKLVLQEIPVEKEST